MQLYVFPMSREQYLFVYRFAFVYILIVFYFVFSAVLLGTGLNWTNLHSFQLMYDHFFIKILNYSIHVTILTVAQNTQVAHLLIIPKCYTVYLVIFAICDSPECAFEPPITQSVHPIEVYLLNLLFLS